jgi:hypothetical protein
MRSEVVPHVSSPRFAVPPHRAVHLVKVGIVHMHVTDEIPLPRLLPHDVGYYPIVLEILDSSNCGAAAADEKKSRSDHCRERESK